jgi:hypothetical protein
MLDTGGNGTILFVANDILVTLIFHTVVLGFVDVLDFYNHVLDNPIDDVHDIFILADQCFITCKLFNA